MRTVQIISSSIAVMIFAGSAMAATSTGTLTITGTLAGSLTLTIESAGGTTSGLGTDDATSDLGTISKHGPVPTGFTVVKGATSFTLSSVIGVTVAKVNLSSSGHTLTAQLQSAPASGLTWKVNGSTLSNVTLATLTTTGAYGTMQTYSWDLVTSESAAAGSIGNTIIFTATSN